MKRSTAVLLALAAGCARPLPKLTVPVNEQYGHLTNGTRVVLLPDRSASLVAVHVHYDVGAKDDPPGRAGLAHLVEHLLFLPRPLGLAQPTLGAALRGHTLTFNASTTWDETAYTSTARGEELAAVLTLEGMRLAAGCGTIGEDVFRREREVVRNEIRESVDDPATALRLQLEAALYGEAHPYHRPVGGDDVQLASITLEDACGFIRDHYVPARATVVLAGDFDPAAARRLVARGFGGVPPRQGVAPVPVPPAQLSPRRTTLSIEGQKDAVLVAWPLPPRNGPEGYVLPLLETRVAQRAAEVGDEKGLGHDVETGIFGGDRAPVLGVALVVEKGTDPDAVAEALFAAAARARDGLEDAGIEAVRYGLMGTLAVGLEPLSDRAAAYAGFAAVAPGGGLARQAKLIAELDGERLRGVARRVLRREQATVVVLRSGADPSPAATELPPFAVTAGGITDELPVEHPAAARPMAPPPRNPLAAGARRFQLANGLRVVLLRSGAPMPVVTARLLFAVGSAHEPAGTQGLATLAAGRACAAAASDFTTCRDSVEVDGTELTARATSSSGEEVIEGLARVGQPRAARGERPADPRPDPGAGRGRRVAARLAMGRAFGDGDVERFAREHYTARNATLIVAGVFDEARVEKEIRERFGRWRAGQADAPVTDAVRARTGPSALGIVGPRSPLVGMLLGYAVPGGMGPGYAARLVLVEMLGRRLHAGVRERLGATYGVHVIYRPALGPSAIEIAGAFDAARGPEALAAVRASVDELRQGRDFRDGFVRARAAVLARLLASPSDSLSLSESLSRMARFGRPADDVERLAAEVAGLSPEAVLALARAELDPAHEVLVCQGTRAALQRTFSGARLAGASIVEP